MKMYKTKRILRNAIYGIFPLRRFMRRRLAGVLFSCFLLCAASFVGGATLQYRAEDFNPDGSWGNANAEKSGVAVTLRSRHSATNGWRLAEKSDGAVWFGENPAGMASPLVFAQAQQGGAVTNNSVASVFAVVYCDATVPLSAFLFSPSSVGFRDAEDYFGALLDASDGGGGALEFEQDFMGFVNATCVNASGSALMAPEAKPQLLECHFADPIALEWIHIGGCSAMPQWKMGWNGGVKEMIFLRVEPDEKQKNSIRRYLSARHKLGLRTRSDSDLVPILNALGIDDDRLFTSIIMVR